MARPRFGKDVAGNGRAPVRRISRHLSEAAEESHEQSRLGQLGPGRNSNLAPAEFNTHALLEPALSAMSVPLVSKERPIQYSATQGSV